jgi:hypothetical protein
MLQARPANANDVKHFYPEITASFRAWACDLDGQVQGIIGLALTRPTACMFSTFNEPLRPYLKSMTVLRLIKTAEAAVKASRVPVLAIAEPSEPTARGMLERLGFEHIGEFEGDEIYRRGGL